MDVHFRYPEDGNIHFSFKYYDTEASLRRVESYYFDTMRVKTFENGQVQISESLRAECEPTRASLFVPEHPLKPIQEYATTAEMFFFPTTGFNAFPDQTPSIFNTVETTPRADDLVVSLDRSEAFNVSFSACLLGRDANRNLWPIEANQQRFQTQDDADYPIIELSALLTPYT